MATQANGDGLHHHGAGEKISDRDLEAHMGNGSNGQGGAGLARQISVQLTHEQFERLYLQPGGDASKGDLSKRLGNPTPIGLIGFLLCLTPFSTYLMGWRGATTAAGLVPVGAFYFVGTALLWFGGIFEFIIGNTFPSTVFFVFGSFWGAFAFLLSPSQAIEETLGGQLALPYNVGIGLYLIWWMVMVFIFMIAALRTNVVFVVLFFCLDITFALLVGVYLNVAQGKLSNLLMIEKAAGAFAFLTCCCGWYLFFVIILASTGIVALPVGDLSNFLSRNKKVE